MPRSTLKLPIFIAERTASTKAKIAMVWSQSIITERALGAGSQGHKNSNKPLIRQGHIMCSGTYLCILKPTMLFHTKVTSIILSPIWISVHWTRWVLCFKNLKKLIVTASIYYGFSGSALVANGAYIGEEGNMILMRKHFLMIHEEINWDSR